eukprot:773837-Pelagomonas_calceolata.AAC.4
MAAQVVIVGCVIYSPVCTLMLAFGCRNGWLHLCRVRLRGMGCRGGYAVGGGRQRGLQGMGVQ